MALPGFHGAILLSVDRDPLAVSAERGGRPNGHVLRFIVTVTVKYRVRTLRHG